MSDISPKMSALVIGIWNGSKENELKACSISETHSSSGMVIVGDSDEQRNNCGPQRTLWIKAGCVHESFGFTSPEEEGLSIGKVMEADSKIFSPLAYLRISSLFSSGFGTYGAISDSGQVYMWGKSSNGQCGVIKDSQETPRLVPIRTKSVSCVHGQQQEGADICIQSLAVSSRGTVALDCDGHVWQWGSILEQDTPSVEPVKINAFYPRKVLSVAAGRGFYCARVQACSINSTDSWEQDSSRTESQSLRQFSLVDSCLKCREDSDFRLSKLMERATLSAQAPESAEDDSKFCPLGLTLQLSPALSPELTPVKTSRGYSIRDVLALAGWDHRSPETTCESRSVKTLAALPENRNDIEMQFRLTEKNRRRSSGGMFSLVSMELLPGNLSSSTSNETGYSTDQDQVVSRDQSSNRTLQKSCKSVDTNDLILEPVEVWAWGDNSYGQLGLGDYIPRRQPTRVERLVGSYVIKLCAGSFHSAALTSTGEIFVWGSNKFGQIKQADSKTAFIPVLLKVGSQSSVLDVTAGSDFTVILVNGLDSRPAVYYCGKNYQDGSSSSLEQICDGQMSGTGTALRLGNIEKLGCALQLRCFGQCILGSFFSSESGNNAHSSETTEQVLSLVLGFVFAELKFSRDLKELHSITTQLYQRTVAQKNEIGSKLMEELRTCLHKFFLAEGTSVLNGRVLISNLKPDSDLTVLDSLLRPSGSQTFAEALRALNAAYCDVVQLGMFAQLEISSTVDSALLRLSMEYGVESQKPYRRLKKLLKMPFNHLQAYVDTGHAAIDLLTPDSVQQESLKKRVTFWKKLQNQLNESVELAEQTYEFWASLGKNSICNSLKVSRRFVLATYEKGSKHGGTIKNISPHNGTKFGWHWQKLLVFSDCIVIVEKREYHLLPYPLVWIIAIQDETKLAVQLLAPESELLLEFENSGAKVRIVLDETEGTTEFVHLVNTAIAQTGNSNGEKWFLGTSPPLRRKGTHKFSSRHLGYPGVSYEGSWILGNPHGSGKLSWPDGQIYFGKLREGTMQGFGIFASPVVSSDGLSQNFTLTKGFWENGQLNGLAVIEYASGARYEGYMKNDSRQGHGVMMYPGKQIMYVGAWSNDKHQGYGVWSTQREKYLGMWSEDKRHGLGALVTIDGTYFSGNFDRGVFIKGKMICPDGTEFVGDFNGLGVLNGKGTLSFANKDYVHGWFYGSLLDSTVKITSATYSRQVMSSPTTPISSALLGMEEDRSEKGFCGVPADQKWTEVFEIFISRNLDLEPECVTQASAFRPANTERAWQALAVSIQQLKMFNEKSEQLADNGSWDSLEMIPNWQAPWNINYLKMVQDYCQLALKCKAHPLSRLVVGMADVFSSVYSSVAAHPLFLNTSVSELRSIVRRIYEIFRLLFPSLPDESGMHEVVLLNLDDSKDRSLSGSASSETPSSFLEDHLIRLTYSTLFTLYAVSNDSSDRHYWQRVTLLNSKSDVTLLDFFGVLRQLWPIELKHTDVLDTPMVCATAKNKYYATAIDTLQRIGSEFCPTVKLQILIKTFEDVTKCVNEYSASPSHVWTMDDLCPVFLYVVVRAQLQRLGAEIQLMEDFLPQMKDMGSVFVMFTTLKACYYQILKEKTGF